MDGFLDDVFDMGLDERQAERRIFEMTNDRHESKLNKIAFNEGYLETCDEENLHFKDEFQGNGIRYSMPLGILLGKIDCYFKLKELGLCFISEQDYKLLDNLKTELKSYKEQLTDDVLKEFENKLITISSNIKNEILI